MQTWYDYRLVWARHPLIGVYAVFVAAALVLAVIGTALRVVPLAILFIPSLAGGYFHHIMVQRRIDE